MGPPTCVFSSSRQPKELSTCLFWCNRQVRHNYKFMLKFNLQRAVAKHGGKILNMLRTLIASKWTRARGNWSLKHWGMIRNPAPVDRWFIPLFMEFQPSKVMQDFFHPQCIWSLLHHFCLNGRTILELWRQRDDDFTSTGAISSLPEMEPLLYFLY